MAKQDCKHIVIIGAGVIGLCSAYYAARRGHRVTVIDRNPEERDGCSFGNAGMIVPSHFVPLAAPGMVALGLKWMWNPQSPFYIKPRLSADLLSWGWKFWRAATSEHVQRSAPLLRDLSFSSRERFEELSALPDGDFGLVQRGLIMLCKTEHALEEEGRFAQQADQLGVPAEVMDAKGLSALEPNVTMDVAGGVYFPKDCHLTPSRFLAAIKRACDALGVTFRWGCEVTGVQRNGRAIAAVSSSDGQVEADEFVLACGSWSPLLARDLDLTLPMQAGKGYSLTLIKPRQRLQICSILTEARVAVTPMGESLRVGGTMEIAGLNEEINASRVQGIINAFPRYYPSFKTSDFEGVPPWRGLRPCSPDGLPYLGRTAKSPNLVVATGHAMMGLSLGPVSGKLVSEIVSGEKPSHDLTLLDPDRYS